jgi:hypothetical protein
MLPAGGALKRDVGDFKTRCKVVFEETKITFCTVCMEGTGVGLS